MRVESSESEEGRVEQLGRTLIVFGAAVALLGFLVTYGGRLPFRLGRLPLDFRIEREHFTVYLPIGTSILISCLLTLVLMLLNRR